MTLVWKTATLPPACLGVVYEAGLGVTSAGAVTAIAVSTGALPAGITVSSTTDPRLVGTPTVTGTFTFTLTGSDSGAVVSPSYTLVVFGTLGDDETVAQGLTPTAMNAQRKLN